MDDTLVDAELTQWFSTYGIITAERILGKLHIILPSSELLPALQSPVSFYHRILQLPLKNVLNGIMLQQANDYHVYAQKLFIDYLLSGESSKGAEAQGALTRESLENERKALVLLGEDFNKKQLDHNNLIASSQASLLSLTGSWKEALETCINLFNTTLKNNNLESKKSLVRQGINHALIHFNFKESSDPALFVTKINEIIKIDLTNELQQKLVAHLSNLLALIMGFDEKMADFTESINEMSEQARYYRTQFYETILRVNTLILLLPDYKINPEQDVINREPLYFDKNIGEN